ncbi:MAG TPA: site-2 protease family protein [Anaerolineae bacterium]|nr:site-2 protease family protein [Anaerolineae bacterium]HID85132.1 RIP metalloprotease [Anaerolineales bacterium]HIQ08237.1 RIP metalloprotease [Anaerolineaceae bacterium]
MLLFVAAIALLILIHELGHFLVAKMLGVEIEEFGIGFPPRLVTLFEWKGTRYTLNWIPLGGFVRPKGEGTPEQPDALRQSPPPVRIAVLLAGPLMNFLAAVILLASIYHAEGIPDTTRVLIAEVAAGSPAEQAGLRPGDILLRLNDQPIHTLGDIPPIIQSHLGETLSVEVERQGQRLTFQVYARPNPPEGQGAMGVGLTYPTLSATPATALRYGAQGTYEFTRLLLTIPARMVQGENTGLQLLGYRGMYEMYQQSRSADQAEAQPSNTLFFFFQISLSLGLLNLMPIPALDGGRILMALGEWITRRQLPQRVETGLNFIGFVLVMGLLILINLKEWLP